MSMQKDIDRYNSINVMQIQAMLKDVVPNTRHDKQTNYVYNFHFWINLLISARKLALWVWMLN